MVVITTLRKIELHPMNYLFLACAFFAFHLLLAYLVDHISIHTAFVICSLVSIALVISYFGADPLAVRVGTAAGTAHRAAYEPEHAYDFGLQTILDGLAALVGNPH